MSLVPSSSLSSSVRSMPPLWSSSSSSSSFSTTTTTDTTTDNTSLSLLSNRLYGLDSPTVWQEFSPLSIQYNSINLGQGFPDWEPPLFVKDCMYESIYNDNMNQYARSYSHLPLAISLSNDYNERYQKTSNDIPMIDPATMIATAVGCTNVLYCALQGLLNPGDEVILFEPSFDIYTSQVRMAGGIPIFVPLRNPPPPNTNDNSDVLQNANDQFIFDVHELEESITSKTKIILLNTPHNPTGKMFTRKELQDIANIVHKYPHITIISDEVYEHIVFQDENDNNNDDIIEHISIATIPNMFDKTLTLSSSGKTFSCTGWKVGWAVGPEHLIKAITAVQQWVNYSAPTPNQHAISKALQIAKQQYEHIESGILYNNYYHWLASDYQRKRSLLINALQIAGMKPIIPQGGFFIMADTSTIDFPYESIYQNQYTDAMPKQLDRSNQNIIMPRDWALSRWLTEEVGVTAIPPSAFYSLERVPLAKNYLRFAFCKSDDTILKAKERFTKYFGSS